MVFCLASQLENTGSNLDFFLIMRNFIKTLIPFVDNFHRHQRFILGARIENMALDILDLLLEAYYGPKATKKAKLLQVNLSIEKLRHLLRLVFELHYLNAKKFDRLIAELLEIGRMVGGWLKSLEKS